jgi:sugar transferase (PEP-CTERM/EpsH1 system associated)
MRIRPLAFIRELARRGHRVTLVCLVQPEWEKSYLEEVTPYCEAVHPIHLKRTEPFPRLLGSLVTSVPLSVAYCASPSFRKTVKQLVNADGFDLLHTEFVRAAPTTVDLNGLPKVLDLVDCMTLAYRRSIRAAEVSLKQRAVGIFEWAKMRGYEKQIINCYDQILVSSPADRYELGSEQMVDILPNGVDLAYFNYYDGKRQGAEIIFLGKMSYYVNVASVLWFYRKVFPMIREQRPDSRFVIVGRNPTKAIKALSVDPAVEVTGTVPDVRPFLRRASVAICPMVSGAGIQNKMLEAMAVGVPCVATTLACQALQVKQGREVLISDSAENFAQDVVELLGMPDKHKGLSQSARNYVERCHDWNLAGATLEKIYLGLSEN